MGGQHPDPMVGFAAGVGLILKLGQHILLKRNIRQRRHRFRQRHHPAAAFAPRGRNGGIHPPPQMLQRRGGQILRLPHNGGVAVADRQRVGRFPHRRLGMAEIHHRAGVRCNFHRAVSIHFDHAGLLLPQGGKSDQTALFLFPAEITDRHKNGVNRDRRQTNGARDHAAGNTAIHHGGHRRQREKDQ